MAIDLSNDLSDIDKENLHFLLSLSDSEFDKFWDTIDSYDRSYAMSLLEVTKLNILDMAQERLNTFSASKRVLKDIMEKS